MNRVPTESHLTEKLLQNGVPPSAPALRQVKDECEATRQTDDAPPLDRGEVDDSPLDDFSEWGID